MSMVDFSYNGKRLSDYGCIIADIVTSSNDSVSLGSNLTFETVRNSSTFIDRIVKVDYEAPATITFDICKNPCIGATTFTDNEVTFLMKWLNKKSFEKFYPIYDDGSFSNIYFNGSFNISAIRIGSGIVGFTLTFTANSPFGYETEQDLFININEANKTFTFYNNSDEYGRLYPIKFVVTCNVAGNLSISNSLDSGNIVRVNNCAQGEIITFDCYNKIISSNMNHPSLYNDFNYNYPRFVSNEDDNQNVITVSLPCDISITYSLVRKVGIII